MEKEKLETFRVFIAEYKTTLTRKYRNRVKWSRPNPNQIMSVIPGTILDIKVKEGQQVKEGEILLIHEAMKMENRVVMPFDGTIKLINVEKGETIPKKHLMVEIKPKA
ncbi:MAG: acetyl-CoA carboxylase biotin carboxyl carrier protein subunit [Cyclobacteriaceae bacterium]|nr:acetyl-CoA carboxylase biotin carboxyl carrier protein subunit [Cyclobacteriaceae bacterium]